MVKNGSVRIIGKVQRGKEGSKVEIGVYRIYFKGVEYKYSMIKFF